MATKNITWGINKAGEKVPVLKKVPFAKLARAIKADTNKGFCMACGASRGQCEPDAQKYECTSCWLPHVYGAEEIVLRGWDC